MAEFVPAAKVGDVPEESGICVRVNDNKVAIFHAGGAFYAIDDTCTHEEASLSGGTLYTDEENPVVECPKHGAMFDVTDGRVLSLPAVRSVNSYETRVEDGTVLVCTEPRQTA